MRLIDAEKAIDELGIEDWEIDCKHFIYDQPTVDAVEVVRCKDCKYKRKLRGNDNLIYCNTMCINMELDAFCSLGAKIEGDIDG